MSFLLFFGFFALFLLDMLCSILLWLNFFTFNIYLFLNFGSVIKYLNALIKQSQLLLFSTLPFLFILHIVICFFNRGQERMVLLLLTQVNILINQFDLIFMLVKLLVLILSCFFGLMIMLLLFILQLLISLFAKHNKSIIVL